MFEPEICPPRQNITGNIEELLATIVPQLGLIRVLFQGVVPVDSPEQTPPKFNIAPNMRWSWLSYWEGNFSGVMLNLVQIMINP